MGITVQFEGVTAKNQKECYDRLHKFLDEAAKKDDCPWEGYYSE